MIKIFHFVMVILFLSPAVISQDNQINRGQGSYVPLVIKGKVTDNETGLALEFATISVFNAMDSSLITGAMTDSEGAFSVNARPGKMYALIEYLSYESFLIDPIPFDSDAIQAGDREVDLGEVKLNISGLIIEGVEVRAEKSETQFLLDKKVFNVGQDIAGRGGTAEDVLDNVPSVTVDIEGNVSLRGNSGVRILIDGRPSVLAGVGEENGLRQLSASMVDKVEVITNPSARYEAEGSAGIINIVLKKDNRSGFNGSFNGSVGYPEQGGLGANLNYRKDKINWFANYSLRLGKSPGGGSLYQEVYKGAETFITDQTRDNERQSLSNSIRGGFDYFLGEKENITGSFMYRKSDQDNTSIVTYNDFLNNLDNSLGSTIRSEAETAVDDNLEFSLNYRKEYSSRNHELKATIQRESRDEIESSLFDEDFFDNGGSGTTLLNQRSENDEHQGTWLFQVDFSYPMSEGEMFETGFRSSLRDIKNDYLVEENTGGIWYNLEGLSNNFNYNEDIHSAYAIYGNKINKFSYQVGLRSEWSLVTTELEQTNELNDRDYLDVFPSAFLNYELPIGLAVQASYSRRLRRPRQWDLNPFFTFSDNRNFFSGNPNLDPEYANSYEVSAIKYLDNATFTASLFYKHTNGKIERIRMLNSDGTTTTRPQNLSTQDDYGLETTFSYSGVKWWRLDGSANFFQSKTNGGNIGENFSANSFTWYSRMTHRFTFKDKSDLQLRLNYRGPRDTTQGRNKGSGSLDLGYSKDFMNNNLTMTFNVRDLFESRKRKYETFGDGFYSQGDYYRRGRSFTLQATYRLNQKKQRQRPQSESEEFQGGEEFQGS